MRILERLFKKKKKLVIGLMSGTSADGIDAALVEIVGSGTRTKLRLVAFDTYPFPRGYKSFLLRNSDASTARLDDIARLNMLVATFFADAVKSITRKAGKHQSDIDLIGSHGQTIHHLPRSTRMFGKDIRATLQIGSSSAIAKLTGIVTVGDFRSGDIAVGGSGAPLVPYFDYVMLSSSTRNRAALNIGGIANITILPATCVLSDVTAFDTGPGNMLIDAVMRIYYGKDRDDGGEVALQGSIVPGLLNWLTKTPYLRQEPPKSTGREMFGEKFLREVLQRGKGMRKQDVVTTVSEFTALSVYDQYIRFVRQTCKLSELFVSGGGVHNAYVMNALRRYFSGVDVKTTDTNDIPVDAKEAICFALLANETIAGNSSNVPGGTGAQRRTTLGVICLP